MRGLRPFYLPETKMLEPAGVVIYDPKSDVLRSDLSVFSVLVDGERRTLRLRLARGQLDDLIYVNSYASKNAE